MTSSFSSSSNRSARSTPEMFIPVAPGSYQSLKAFRAAYKDKFGFDGDAYIAARVWDTEDYKMESFGESPNGDDVQARLQTFLDQDPTRWKRGQSSERKAKWIEIVGDVGVKGDRPAWLHTLCKRLKLRSTVFNRAREGCQSQVRNPVEGTTVVQYGHVAHVRYDFSWMDLDVFVLPTNEIITVYAQRSVLGVPSTAMANLHEPPCPPLQELVNAATVLWRLETVLTEELENHLTSFKLDHEETTARLKHEVHFKGQPWERLSRRSLERESNIPLRIDYLNKYIQQPLEQIDNVCRQFLDHQSKYTWLETDLKAEFERQTQNTQHILRGIQLSQSTYDSLRCSREISRADEIWRIAQKQEFIAAEQAKSAASLNRLVAVFAFFTVICAPFVMTAAFFSMNNIINPTKITTHKFGVFIGKATASVAVAGLVLACLLRYWRDIIQWWDKKSGYRDWRIREMRSRISVLNDVFCKIPIQERFEELAQLRKDCPEAIRQRKMQDDPDIYIDLSRGLWARKKMRKGVARVGGCVKGTLVKTGSSGQAPAAIPLLPTSSQAGSFDHSVSPSLTTLSVQPDPSGQTQVVQPPPANDQNQSQPQPEPYRVIQIKPEIQIQVFDGTSRSQTSSVQSQGSSASFPLPASGAPLIMPISPSQISLPASLASSLRSTSPSQVLQLASPATPITFNSQIQGSSASSITPNVRNKESWEAYGC